MIDKSEYNTLYTKANGQPAAKWILITSVLVAFTLFCLALVFYLPSHPLLPVDKEGDTRERAFIDLVPPDFSSITVIDERKNAFFDFLVPLIQQENQRILRSRQKLAAVKAELDNNGALDKRSRAYVRRLVEEYRFEEEALELAEQIDKLLHRVDVIPASMVLAQAATESAWGTSRFAKTGNNFFGQWCFKKGCGTVPRLREQHELHEVASFGSALDSVRSYFMNINTHHAYRHLRKIRAGLPKSGSEITGMELIKGLGSYSERGQHYIAELRQIIAGNQLSQWDDPQSAKNENG